MEEKYDIRKHAVGLAFLKQELNRILNVIDDGSIDMIDTVPIIEEATKKALEYVNSMLEPMARDHPDWQDRTAFDAPTSQEEDRESRG